MAIKTFKEILQNKGYRIEANDRQIFENGTVQSFFGLSDSDCIEFIIYDSNDNQLPQSSYGLVRYIPMTSQTIGDYFLIAEGTLIQRYKFPSEYFIDVERLLREAGYSNGIFKTQITLINKRAGSEKTLDKLWISEISPSRTEIRLFPNTKGIEINPELKERFNLLLSGGDFRDDVSKFAIEYVEKIKANSIGSLLKQKYGNAWFDRFVSEYKIQSMDIFSTQVYNKFLESAINEFTGRISDINDMNYGLPKPFKPSLSLTKDDVRKTVEKLLVNAISKYLSIPDVRFGSRKNQKMESLDTSEKVLQTKTSDLTIDTSSPIISKAVLKTAAEASKKLSFAKAIQEETLEPSVQPAISKARLRRDALSDGVYGGSVGMSDNMRILNGGFRNDGFRDNGSAEAMQNQQLLL
jgi:hypothetical protein